ncbi:MAG: tetratricopeptide repeat protein [Bacteroidota bacterium]
MKKLTALFALAAMFALPLSAQKSKINSGAIAVQGGDIAGAIEKLEEGLAKPELLGKKEAQINKMVAKGHWNLYKAYYTLATDETQTELREKYPDYLFKALESLEKATEDEVAGKSYRSQSILGGFKYNVWTFLYNDGVSKFNAGEDKVALKYFLAADRAYPEHFLTNRMLGSAYLINKDSAKCTSYLENCIKIFKAKYDDSLEGIEEVKAGDAYKVDYSQLSYIYQQLIVLQEAMGETEKALATAEDGIKMIPDDNEGVKRQELAIYQAHPEMVEIAEKKFKAALAENPDDNNIRVAYANLLEKNKKPEEAFKLYSEAYERDDQSLQANYGIAAYYINRAAIESEKKMKLKRDDEIDAADEVIKGLCEKAYPHLVWLHNAQPKEAEWLSQLVNITPIIGKRDEMELYGKKLGELTKK